MNQSPSVEEIIREALRSAKTVQLGTSAGDQPWICTVHFYADEGLNLYWTSTVDRRHSKEIAKNPKAAAYLLVHENTPEEDYVIGISVEGTAQLFKPQNEMAAKGYVRKHGKDSAAVEAFVSGEKPFYKLTPSKIVLFDNKHFPDNTRQEWHLG